MATVTAMLERARGMLGKDTVYWAGAGGLDPIAPTPARRIDVARTWQSLSAEDRAQFAPLAQQAGIDVNDPALRVPACDCTGFLCWVLGISRKAPRQAPHTLEGGWINTDSIWEDATHGGSVFQRIERAEPGCVVVYPKAGSGERYGHDGLVTAVDGRGVATRVIHCSASNFGTPPFDAIQENGPTAFLRQPKTVYARFRLVR